MSHVDDAMMRYRAVYRALYHREPRQLEGVEGDLILVNGIQMTIEMLDLQTKTLQQELLRSRRGVVNRLVSWLRGSTGSEA